MIFICCISTNKIECLLMDNYHGTLNISVFFFVQVSDFFTFSVTIISLVKY